MLFDKFSPLHQPIAHYVLPVKNQHIENEKVQRRARGAIVLQAVEGWPAGFIERDNFAIDDGLIREVGQRSEDSGIPRVEIVIVARPQMYFASVFMAKARYPSSFSS